jgi:hypothetical protein
MIIGSNAEELGVSKRVRAAFQTYICGDTPPALAVRRCVLELTNCHSFTIGSRLKALCRRHRPAPQRMAQQRGNAGRRSVKKLVET